MCLVRECWIGLHEMAMAAFESQYIEAVNLGLTAAVGGVIDVSELLLVLLALALGLGGAAPQSTKLLHVMVSGYQLDGGEHMVIPDIMPVHLTHISQASGSSTDEGTGSIPGVPDAPTDESEEELSWNSTDDEGADNEGKNGDDNEEDEGDDGEEGDGDNDDEDDDGEEEYDEAYVEVTRDEESFDPILKTFKNNDDEGNGDEDISLNIGGEEGHIEEEEEDELYRDVNINQGRGLQTTLEVEDSHVTLTLVNPDEANISEFTQMNQFAEAVSAIPEIVQRYMDQRMNEAVKVVVKIQFDRLHNEAQRENEEFLKTVDENMQKIIKEHVKEQVKEDEGGDDEDDKEKGDDDEQASDEEEFIHPSLSTHTEEEPRDEKSFDPIPKTPKDSDDEGNGEENLGLNVGREEGHVEE
nr:hypothetical protein [Tanacetum cinerariifolium]